MLFKINCPFKDLKSNFEVVSYFPFHFSCSPSLSHEGKHTAEYHEDEDRSKRRREENFWGLNTFFVPFTLETGIKIKILFLLNK